MPKTVPLVSIDPAEVIEANRRYHDACVDEYERRGGDTHAGYPHYVRRVSAHLDMIAALLPRPECECLAMDCGAGSGFFTRLLLDRGFQVVAVEVSSAMRNVLRERLGTNSRLEVVDRDLESFLEGCDRNPELISFVSVLHHLYDYVAVLALAAERLAPGGVLYTTCDPVPSRRPQLAGGLRLVDRALYGLRRPKRLAAWLARRKRIAVPFDRTMELAEFHARVGVDLDRIRAVLTSAGLIPIMVQPNPSGKAAVVRGLERLTGAGTDLGMIWQRPAT